MTAQKNPYAQPRKTQGYYQNLLHAMYGEYQRFNRAERITDAKAKRFARLSKNFRTALNGHGRLLDWGKAP